MRQLIRRFLPNTSGATAVEYSLVVAIVSVSAIAGMDAFGTSLVNMIMEIAETIEGVVTIDQSQG